MRPRARTAPSTTETINSQAGMIFGMPYNTTSCDGEGPSKRNMQPTCPTQFYLQRTAKLLSVPLLCWCGQRTASSMERGGVLPISRQERGGHTKQEEAEGEKHASAIGCIPCGSVFLHIAYSSRGVGNRHTYEMTYRVLR